MSDTPSQVPGRLRQRTAEEIRVILARRRMSAAELARKTGIRQQSLSRRMTGDTAFDLDDLEVIAQALGVRVTDLLGGGGDASQTTVAKLRLPVQPGPTAIRPSSERPRDNRPKGRAGSSGPGPATRRPVRV